MADLQKRAKFQQELQTLINRHNREEDSNTPDFLLAEYIQGCLSIYEHTVTKRDQLVTLALRNKING